MGAQGKFTWIVIFDGKVSELEERNPLWGREFRHFPRKLTGTLDR